MATADTYGRCKCGEFNPLSAIVCIGCGARLPWAGPGAKGAKAHPSVVPNSALSGTTQRTQSAQTGYWSSALGGAQSGYGNDPDIDLTPMTRADHYCPSCGMGLSRTQDACPRCRHMRNFTRADLRLSLMVGALITTGFLLGVVWTGFLVTYLKTGTWPLQSTATTQTTAAKNPTVTSASKPAARSNDYDTR